MAQQDHLRGQKDTLDRRVPTRWNSDFACLSAHALFRVPVSQLTSDPANNLTEYKLTDDQWVLVTQLLDADVLQVCFLCLALSLLY